MKPIDTDVAVLGSGFSGSLLAAILARHGRRVVLIDRDRHPRFAIGESSTPAASLILRSLADRFGLDWLRPLSSYGTWKASYPDLTCGLKRGFAYFQHEAGRSFSTGADHVNELLVAASAADSAADTQWLRSEVDQFLFERACGEGVVPVEAATVDSVSRDASMWSLTCVSGRETGEVRCRFLVDGTGTGRFLQRQLKLPDESQLLKTQSTACFGHFAGLPEWSEVLSRRAPGAVGDHPFPCDRAALHHLLADGWMWWLRFDHGITSVGMVSGQPESADQCATPRQRLQAAVSAFPDLRDALQQADVVAPSGGPGHTGRLQRLTGQTVGDGWALLPHTAGFVDPLHSTGIAQSLLGVERLAEILLLYSETDDRRRVELDRYAAAVRAEILHIDQLVHGCYEALRQGSFRKFVAWTMCYFCAATTWERQRLAASGTQSCLYLAQDAGFRDVVLTLERHLATESDDVFEQMCEEYLEPWNRVGLFRPEVPNMYARTAVPESAPPAGSGTGRLANSGHSSDTPPSD